MPLPCRIACVRIGRFATGAVSGRASAASADGGSAPAPQRRTGPPAETENQTPLVLFTEIRGVQRLVALDAVAARRGIITGMAVAQAKAYAADLLARRYDGERIARAALDVTTALLAASPRVSWELGHGVWWLDAAGLGSEPRLAKQIGRAHV